jgi:hypothetical protein
MLSVVILSLSLMLNVSILSVIILNIGMLSVIFLRVVKLNVNMLSVIVLHVAMLNVVAPIFHRSCDEKKADVVKATSSSGSFDINIFQFVP